jgi:hypothetical protein
MSNVHKPAVAGKDSDPPATLTEILRTLRMIAIRLDTLETRFEYLDRDVLKAIGSESKPVTLDEEDHGDEAPLTEPDPAHVPGLARLSNGRVAVSIVHLDGIDLGDRVRWEGVILTEAEACDALDRVSDASDEAAGHVAGRIRQTKKRDEGDS